MLSKCNNFLSKHRQGGREAQTTGYQGDVNMGKDNMSDAALISLHMMSHSFSSLLKVIGLL